MQDESEPVTVPALQGGSMGSGTWGGGMPSELCEELSRPVRAHRGLSSPPPGLMGKSFWREGRGGQTAESGTPGSPPWMMPTSSPTSGSIGMAAWVFRVGPGLALEIHQQVSWGSSEPLGAEDSQRHHPWPHFTTCCKPYVVRGRAWSPEMVPILQVHETPKPNLHFPSRTCALPTTESGQGRQGFSLS